METNIVIGNLISLLASVFLALSCIAKDRDRVYLFQFAESAILTVSAIFFGSWAGLTTLFLSMTRNFLVWRRLFKKWHVPVMAVLVIAAGLTVNNRGWLGIIPIAATVELTIANYYASRLIAIKTALLFNTSAWVVYSYLIRDYVSAVSSTAIVILTAISIGLLLRDRRIEKKSRL